MQGAMNGGSHLQSPTSTKPNTVSHITHGRIGEDRQCVIFVAS